MDVGGWLRNLGLGQYESAFIENAIGTDILPELTEGDLEKLGVPLGDRKRLIKAIKALAGGSPSPLITSEVGENAPSDYSPIAAAERRHLTVIVIIIKPCCQSLMMMYIIVVKVAGSEIDGADY